MVIDIDIPLWQLAVLVPAVLLTVVLPALYLRQRLHRRAAPGDDPDWSVPPLTVSGGASPFQRWDVRCKIVTILVYSFMLASLRHPAPAAAAVGLSVLALAAARPSYAKVFMRLMALTGFVGMFLVVMPFTVPVHAGDTVLVFNHLERIGFNLRGLELAALIAAKAVAITLLMEPLLSTAPLPVTLHGLSRLGVPEMMAQMVLLSHRYLYVLRHEAQRMSSGMRVRGFRKRTDLQTLRAVSNFLGMLFVRSYERTERVFDAMRARGYRGRFPAPVDLRIGAGDVIAAGIWLVAGAALVLWDRLLA
jgi:cobalt/nickel transport system permease protein